MTTATMDSCVEAVRSQATPEPARVAPSGKRWARGPLPGLVGGVIALSGAGTWYAVTGGHESTDVARVDAEVLAVPAHAAGTVRRVYVLENQFVKEGDLVATLDSDLAEARLAQADAAVSAAIATAAAAEADARVAEAMVNLAGAQGGTSRFVARDSAAAHRASHVEAVVVQARARAYAARLEVETAQAALSLASLDLLNTRVVALRDGVVSKKAVAGGEAVAAGQTIVQLVTPGIWVTAQFKEAQLARMHAGQPVAIRLDALSSVKLDGKVEGVSGPTGSRLMLLPPDSAPGNDTASVHRVPVRIRVTPAQGIVLRRGMSVDVTVNTRT